MISTENGVTLSAIDVAKLRMFIADSDQLLAEGADVERYSLLSMMTGYLEGALNEGARNGATS